MQIGQLFRAKRLRLNWTQADLAQRARIDVSVVRRLEAGQAVDESQLAAMAQTLGIDAREVREALSRSEEDQRMQQEYSRLQSEAPRARREAPQATRDAAVPPRMRHGMVDSQQEEQMRRAWENGDMQLPSEEEERRLQEIRRQRRRQAYEGTLREKRTQSMRPDAMRKEPRPMQEPTMRAPQQAEAYYASGSQQSPLHDAVRDPMRDSARYEGRDMRAAYEDARAEYESEQARRAVRAREVPVREDVQPRDDVRPMHEQARHEEARRQVQNARPASDASEGGDTPVRTFTQMLELTADVAQLTGRETVLEIGCGQGVLTRVLAARSRFVAALDSSARALEQNRAACAAQGIENVDFLEGDARRLPIESDSFDVVFVPMILHHVVSPAQVLMEARRVVKPGGRVIVTELMPSDVPAQQRIQNAVEVLKNPSHIGVIPMQEIMRMMQYAHLEVLDRRVLDQTWEFTRWVDAMGARERMEPLRALMRSFALQGNRAGMDLSVDEDGRMTFIYRWMFLVCAADE